MMKRNWLVIWALAAAIALSLWSCGTGDDDDDGEPTPSDDDQTDDDQTDDDQADDDNDAGQPTGACVCCFFADGQAWGYCWAVGFADECESGCKLLYDEEHFLQAIFTPDAHCLDLDADEMCR